MDHSLPLITTLAIAFGFALIFGFLVERVLRAPALVGYLIAGIMAGQYTPGPVADSALASQLSEIGVILLMFGVGLHFSVKDLLKVKTIALPGAILQMTLATVLGMAFAMLVWEWTASASLVFGLCLSCASTVVLLKAMEMQGKLNTIDGQVAVGWLVVEDMATVLILVLLPPIAVILQGADTGAVLSWKDTAWIIGSTIARVAAFVAIMLLFGRRILPWLLWQVAKTGSRELFTLFLLAGSIGIAYGAAYIFDVSFALGAFFAGMVIRESQYAKRAAEDTLPLQDAFSVLFFVGVGMMLDWHAFIEHPFVILVMLSIIILGKGLVAMALVLLLRYPLHTSLTVATSLAQIGEFSYILAAQGIALKMIDSSVMSLIVAASILSIALNPGLFAIAPFVLKKLTNRFEWARRAAGRQDPFTVLPENTQKHVLQGQAVLVGSSRELNFLASALAREAIPFVCVAEKQETVEKLREKKYAAIFGKPDDPAVLSQAHLQEAALLVIAADDQVKARKIIDTAREIKKDIEVMVRVDSEEERALFTSDGVRHVFNEQKAIATAFATAVARTYDGLDDEDAIKPIAGPAAPAAAQPAPAPAADTKLGDLMQKLSSKTQQIFQRKKA